MERLLRFLFVIVFLATNIAIGLNAEQTPDNITLIEEFTVDNYVAPNNVMFYSSGHEEYVFFYEKVFKRIKKNTKKGDIKTKFLFNDINNWNQDVQFYNSSVFFTPNKSYPFVCFYEHGRINENIEKYCYDGQCEFYFYITLVDTTKNKVLIKRKYKVQSETYYYTQCENLADEIIKELQLKS